MANTRRTWCPRRSRGVKRRPQWRNGRLSSAHRKRNARRGTPGSLETNRNVGVRSVVRRGPSRFGLAGLGLAAVAAAQARERSTPTPRALITSSLLPDPALPDQALVAEGAGGRFVVDGLRLRLQARELSLDVRDEQIREVVA